MIQLIGFVVIAGMGNTPLKAHDLFYASEDRLKVVVGKRTSPPREPGIRFEHPGYYEVWVDSAGPNMKHIRLGLGKMATYKEFLSSLGLGVAKAAGHPQPTANSPIPLFRNKISVTGVTGLPISPTRKSWQVTFVEYAVANKGRLKSLKSQIKALPVGDSRNALIRTCYDWWAELDFTTS